MCKLTEGHAKKLIETVERLYITVATIPLTHFLKVCIGRWSITWENIYSPENMLLLFHMKMSSMTDFKQNPQVGN